jgi:molecular chaperone GrpE
MNNNEEEIEETDDLEPLQDDIAPEEELEDIEENGEAKLKKIKLELKECKNEKMGYLEDLQRAKAEFLNAKRRLEEERVLDKERAVTKQIEKLLPMCDSFHMAMSDKKAWDAIDPTWRRGVESIYTQLQSILTSYGVEEVHPQGVEFNPQEHEAMTSVTVGDKAHHDTIVSVIQNGFVRKINDKVQLIRPARVIVGEFKE